MVDLSKSTKVFLTADLANLQRWVVFLTADLSKSAKWVRGISVSRFEQICSGRFEQIYEGGGWGYFCQQI